MVQEYIRPYEISIWTLLDSFVTVLKWSEMENRGLILNGAVELIDDGTEKFSFSVPMYYYDGDKKIKNPLWTDFNNNVIIANLHKLKIIFNKKTADEVIFEFLITIIEESHERDEIRYEVTCEGLPFHELGKIGYKISLSADEYLNDYENWFKNGDIMDDPPEQNILYWNDKVFKFTDADGNVIWRYNWEYEVNMDWSSFSLSHERDPHKVYEEEYVSSWKTAADYVTLPKAIEKYREKWRPVEVKESNVYNITQTIAETFGVFCKYKYDYDDNYHIIKRRVIYYNNFILDSLGHIDLTYPYLSSSITRTIDNSETITKLYVRPVDLNTSLENITTIMNVEANKSREDYLLNFDYLYETGNLTDELYAEIPKYETIIRLYNNKLSRIETLIGVLEDNCITEEANITLYTNAINLDTERENNARALRDLLTGNNEGIVVNAIKPEMLILKEDSRNVGLKYATISLLTVIPSTVLLFETINYTVADDANNEHGRLKDKYTGGKFEYDEFGNLSKITNIKTDATKLYMTCIYSPKLYYDNVVTTWQARRYKDLQALDEANERYKEFRTLLDGGNIGYARADIATADCAINVDGYLVDESYTDMARTEDGNGYLYLHEVVLKDKLNKIIQFEKFMGSSIREGYWLPDNYTDYGDKYLDRYSVDFINKTIEGSTKFASFIWDTEAFGGETELCYEVGTDLQLSYHILVDLSNCLEEISHHLDELSFIYYDLSVELINADDATRARRSFTIGSACEYGYVLHLGKYKPVLVLTGAAALPEEWISSVTNTTGDHLPFLGVIKSEYDPEALNVVTTVNTLYSNLTFINPEEVTSVNSKGYKALCYPRICVTSLQMKNDEKEIMLSSNNTTLDMFDDYYVLIRTEDNGINSVYYVTIKPKFIIANVYKATTIGFSYALSNADVAIYLDALEVMKENSKPKVSYTILLSILNKEFIHTAYNKLNRIVHINDIELLFNDVNGYISSLKLDLDLPQNDSVEVKNYATKFEDLFSTIVALTEEMKKNTNVINLASLVIGSNGIIATEALLKSLLKVDLNYAFNNGKLTIDDKNGIWGTSEAGVVAFRGGGIFTATEKDNTGNWIWNTGILPSGINADLITSGLLDTNKIKIYAGDKVKFLLNGEGLFAYKSLFSDYNIQDNERTREYIRNKTGSNDATESDNEIDSSQYVTFNEDALFLIAKAGALVLNDTKDDYYTINAGKDVERVAISWDGLVLKNWEDTPVFYAEPETGNLHLKGHIEANSGKIGGWDLSDKAFKGTYMWLVNDNLDPNNSGIFLTNLAVTSELTVVHNGTTLYAYTLNNKTYYYALKLNSVDLSQSHGPVYGYETYILSVTPKYTKTDNVSVTIASVSEGSNTNPGNSSTYTATANNVTQNSLYTYTVTYVADNNNTFTTDKNGNRIEYNGSTASNSSWYTKLVEAGKTNRANIVEATSTSLSEISGLSGTMLLVKVTPTFSVLARTGAVTINAGTIGAMQITPSGLSQGSLTNTTITNSTITSSNIMSGNVGYSTNVFGELFKDCITDSTSGQIIFKKVNNTTVNFKIADTTYFKSLVSAAKVINLTLTVEKNGNNSTVTATAISNQQNIGGVGLYTATASATLEPVYSSGVSAGDAAYELTHAAELAARDVANVASGMSTGWKAAYDVSTHSLNFYIDPGERLVVKVPGSSYGSSSTVVVVANSSNCFIGGTLVLLADGTEVPIENLLIGMMVKALNEDYNYFETGSVMGILKFQHGYGIYDIVLSTGKIITATDEHPILTDHGWCSINPEKTFRAKFSEAMLLEEEPLKIGDKLYTDLENEDVYVTDLIPRIDLDGEPVYNLDIEPYDNYIINNVVVHNDSSDPGGGAGK